MPMHTAFIQKCTLGILKRNLKKSIQTIINLNRMASRLIVRLSLALLMLNQANAWFLNETNTKCQFGRPLRKQVNAEPLRGLCLHDIVMNMSKTLQSIADRELGFTDFQKTLDKMEFSENTLNLDSQLDMLVGKLNSKLLSYLKLLQRSNNVIQPILLKTQSKSIYPSQTIGFDILHDSGPYICKQIETALVTNIRNQDWKNLHVLPVMQPGTMCGPSTLAHNIGLLLLSQCNHSKKVILLLEHNALISEEEFASAQGTAKTIIDMLSETDYITVIGLAGHGFVYCNGNLMKATDINKYQLVRYIYNMERIDSNETLNIDFSEFTYNLEGDLVIIHLTNTLQESTNMKYFVDSVSSKQLNIHLGTILIHLDQESHSNMKESYPNESVIVLPTQNILGYEIARLFSGLKCNPEDKKDYYLSDPFFVEPDGKMSVSIGQITKTALLSLDIKLGDFLDVLTYFNAGPNVYVILFDTKGIVWMHKDFPRMETMIDQPFKVYMQDIENIDNETVMTMINQYEGSISVVTKLNVQKRYRWKHLTYKDLIICIVSRNDEGSLPFATNISTLKNDLLHHRLDLLLQTVEKQYSFCVLQNRISTLSTGTVYLSPWCFQSPMEQLKLLETGSDVTVQSYMAYIKDSTKLLANPGLHNSVRSEVSTLSHVLEHFKRQHFDSPLNEYIMRRYIVATVSGVLEVFPGMVLDSNLDPKRRSWFGKALEHPGKTILTPPYLDAGGSGYVITISRTVFKGHPRGEHSKNDQVMAVLSMDVTMGYISKFLLQMYPFCNETAVKCFLMDDKGYLVSHHSLFGPTSKVEHQHLTHKELLVANDILNHEFFVKKKLCASLLDNTIQRYYQFNTSLDEVLTNIVHGEHCVKYQVAAVPGTNVFLGVVNRTCTLLRAFCPCSTMDRLCLNCKRMEQTECECPCECHLYSASCTHQHINNIEPCPAPYEHIINSPAPWIPPNHLKMCPTFNCNQYQTEWQCLGIVGCQWCHKDSDGETPLQTPFCSDVSSCFKGVFGSMISYTDGTYNSQSTDDITTREWPSVGPVAGGILAFVLILGVTLFCYRLRSVNSSLEHQCLHLHTSPDTLRMTHLDGEADPLELDQSKNHIDSLLRDNIAPISPYRVSTNYRRPPGGDSDHGYSTMTPHDDSEQQTFVEPLLIVSNNSEPDLIRQTICTPSPTTHLESPHHVLAPVTVHRLMETNYC